MLKETKVTSFRNRTIKMPVLIFNTGFEGEHNYELIKLLKKIDFNSPLYSYCAMTSVDPNDKIVKICKGVNGDCKNCCFYESNVKLLGIKILEIILKSNYR